jgi:hypothetical protein
VLCLHPLQLLLWLQASSSASSAALPPQQQPLQAPGFMQHLLTDTAGSLDLMSGLPPGFSAPGAGGRGACDVAFSSQHSLGHLLSGAPSGHSCAAGAEGAAYEQDAVRGGRGLVDQYSSHLHALQQQQQQQQQQQALLAAQPAGVGGGPACCTGGGGSGLGAASAGGVHAGDSGEQQGPHGGSVCASIQSIQNVLTALFVASMGLIMSPVFLWHHAAVLLCGTLVVTVAKAAVVTGVVRMFGVPMRLSACVGLSMAHIGEFSFVLLSMAQQLKLLSTQVRPRVCRDERAVWLSRARRGSRWQAQCLLRRARC